MEDRQVSSLIHFHISCVNFACLLNIISHDWSLKSGQPFALAGLWEVWQPGKGEVITSCTIITTPANELMQNIHRRMPAILPPEAYPRWLDPARTEPASLENLLCPYESELMEALTVRNTVNNPANDGPECIAPLS